MVMKLTGAKGDIGEVTLDERGTVHFTGTAVDTVRKIWVAMGDFFNLKSDPKTLMRLLPCYMHGRMAAHAEDYEPMGRAEYDQIREALDGVSQR